MAKTEAGAKAGITSGVQSGDAPPALSAGIRRHLGKNLRSFYADTLTEPVSERLESLLARLTKPGS